MAQYVYAYVCRTHLFNWSTPSCNSATAACNDVTVHQHLIECWLTLTGFVSMTFINAKATSIHDNDYSCRNSYRTCLTNHVVHITPHHTTSLGSARAHTHAYRRPDRKKFKKPGWCAWFNIQICVCPCSMKLWLQLCFDHSYSLAL